MKLILCWLMTALLVGLLVGGVFGFTAIHRALSAARRCASRALASLATRAGHTTTWRGHRKEAA